MAVLARFLCALLLCVCGAASATIAPANGVRFATAVGPAGDNTSTSALGVFSNSAAACVAHAAWYTAHRGTSSVWNPGTITSVWLNDSGAYGRCMAQLNGANKSSDALALATSVCPTNSTLTGGSCVCTAPAVEDSTHTSCVIPDPLKDFCQQHAAAKNTFKISGIVAVGTPLPSYTCYVPDPPFDGIDALKGCTVSSINNEVGVPAGDGKTINWAATGSFDGTTCDASPTAPIPPAKDDPCPGGFAGTVNGVTKCVPADPNNGIQGTKSSSSTDSNGTKTDVTQNTNCSGVNCTTTTTTTTTTSSGTVTSSNSSQTQSITDKCQADPANPVCQKTQGGMGTGVSQGSCQTNPSAQGCGGSGAPVGSLYAAKGKTVAQAFAKAKDDLNGTQLGSSVTNFFTVSEGGSCPRSSATIPYLNKSVTIDAWCSDFAAGMFLIVRMVLLVCAGFMAFRVAIDY